MEAALSGQLEIVKELLTVNNNINVDDFKGRTALMDASKSGHLPVVEECLRQEECD